MNDRKIYRTVFLVEVFSKGPYEIAGDDGDLRDIAYDITEGNCIGDCHETERVELHPDNIHAELLRIGNDGTFFDQEEE